MLGQQTYLDCSRLKVDARPRVTIGGPTPGRRRATVGAVVTALLAVVAEGDEIDVRLSEETTRD